MSACAENSNNFWMVKYKGRPSPLIWKLDGWISHNYTLAIHFKWESNQAFVKYWGGGQVKFKHSRWQPWPSFHEDILHDILNSWHEDLGKLHQRIYFNYKHSNLDLAPSKGKYSGAVQFNFYFNYHFYFNVIPKHGFDPRETPYPRPFSASLFLCV